MAHNINLSFVTCCAFVAFQSASLSLGAISASAEEWAGGQTSSFSESTPCVLLRNGNVVYGTARQHGEQILVQRGDGSGIRLDRKDVLCWSDTLLNLYQYRLDHRAGSSFGAHLSDARWCLRYGLLKQAKEEVQRAREFDPSSPQIELLYRQVNGAIANAGNTPEVAIANVNPADSVIFQSSVTVDDSPVSQVDHEDVAFAIEPDRLHDFVSQVQPILLNRCGSCHSHNSQQAWQLITPPRGARTSARMTRENYLATIRYIDFAAPESSELLRYALTSHGGVPSALGPRNALATQTLKRWLQSVADHQPQNPDSSETAFPSGSGDSVELMPGTSKTGNQPASTTALKPANDESSNHAGLQRLPQVENPFDPDLFNRKFHPNTATSDTLGP